MCGKPSRLYSRVWNSANSAWTGQVHPSVSKTHTLKIARALVSACFRERERPRLGQFWSDGIVPKCRSQHIEHFGTNVTSRPTTDEAGAGGQAANCRWDMGKEIGILLAPSSFDLGKRRSSAGSMWHMRSSPSLGPKTPRRQIYEKRPHARRLVQRNPFTLVRLSPGPDLFLINLSYPNLHGLQSCNLGL